MRRREGIGGKVGRRREKRENGEGGRREEREREKYRSLIKSVFNDLLRDMFRK